MKYRALKIIAVIYMIASVLVALAAVGFGVLLAITPSVAGMEYTANGWVFEQGPPMVGQGIAVALGGILVGVVLFGFGELINLFIAVEANTRLTSEYFKARSRPRPSSSDRPGATDDGVSAIRALR